jgi:hypothetical protein
MALSISQVITVVLLFRALLLSPCHVVGPQLSLFLFSFREPRLSFKTHVVLVQLELSSIVLISSVQ